VWTARSAGERGRARHGMSAGVPVSRGPRTELAGGFHGAARQRVGLTESTSRLRIRSNARTLMARMRRKLKRPAALPVLSEYRNAGPSLRRAGLAGIRRVRSTARAGRAKRLV
jgi:hypothetical protein